MIKVCTCHHPNEMISSAPPSRNFDDFERSVGVKVMSCNVLRHLYWYPCDVYVPGKSVWDTHNFDTEREQIWYGTDSGMAVASDLGMDASSRYHWSVIRNSGDLVPKRDLKNGKEIWALLLGTFCVKSHVPRA